MTTQALLAIVAVQFFIHALGWTMTARLARRWRSAEGYLALFWFLLALGLALLVPPWDGGGALPGLAGLLLVAAAMAEHRALALHWGRPTRLQSYAAGLALAAALIAASFAVRNGLGLRVAAVAFGYAAMLLLSVRLLLRYGRASSSAVTTMAAGGYALIAALLLACGVQALRTDAQASLSSAPGYTIAFAVASLLVGGLINLLHIRIVLGRLGRHALTDDLTGMLNRRGLMERLQSAHTWARAGRAGYALMMVDVDHFKAVNDQHGHALGDQVLQAVAASLRAALRSTDLVGRWGGEEFCVLLPNTRLADAEPLARRVAERVAAADICVRVTVSIGVSEHGPADLDLHTVIRRADSALYQAKETGRNRVVAAA
ncbi:MAG: GGDEF domain-containing protein [Acidovorax sp.]